MIHWITPAVGTSACSAAEEDDATKIVDVRDLVDREGNSPEVVAAHLEQAIRALERGQRVVICCDMGESRSNAVAAGVLTLLEGVTFYEATARIADAAGAWPRLEVLKAVRRALRLLRPQEETRFEDQIETVLVTRAAAFPGTEIATYLQSLSTMRVIPVPSLSSSAEVAATYARADSRGVGWILHPSRFTGGNTPEALGYALAELRNVLDFCREYRARLIFVSRWDVYAGHDEPCLYADEDAAPTPRGIQAETAFLSEALIREHTKLWGLKCTVLRVGPLLGTQQGPAFISGFVKRARSNQPIATHLYRNGPAQLDLLSVTDLADAIVRVIERNAIGEWNLGSREAISVPEVAQLVAKCLGSRSQLTVLPVDTVSGSVTLSVRKAEAELGWRARASGTDAIEAFVRHAAGMQAVNKVE